VPGARRLAEQHGAHRHDRDRHRRLQQEGVQGGRRLQAQVDQRIEGRHAGRRQDQDDTGALEQDAALAPGVAGRERGQQRRRERPAAERQRDRRRVDPDRPTDQEVAGPEGHGQDQQQVGVLAQASQHGRSYRSRGRV